MLLLAVAHPERLSAPLVAEQVNGTGKPGFDDGVAAMARYPICERLGEIECPTLIVWDDLDWLVTLRDAAEFEWLIRDARRIVYHLPSVGAGLAGA